MTNGARQILTEWMPRVLRTAPPRALLCSVLLCACTGETGEEALLSLPDGVGAACTQDADCADGLICIVETEPAAGYQEDVLNTCGIACSVTDQCGLWEGVSCYHCATQVEPAFCDFDGCK
jgi:hypothetical protein